MVKDETVKPPVLSCGSASGNFCDINEPVDGSEPYVIERPDGYFLRVVEHYGYEQRTFLLRLIRDPPPI